MLLIRRKATHGLEQPLHGNAARERIEVCILNAGSLLEFCVGLGLGGDQLRARLGPLHYEVAGNHRTRFIQLEAILLLKKGAGTMSSRREV